MKTEESFTIGPKLFFDALREGKDIQEIVDIGYELLGNPILAIDASYKVLAYTKNVKADEPNWYNIVNNRYLPYYVISHKEIKEVNSQFDKSKSILVNKPENFDFEILNAAIVIDNKIFGYIIIPGILKNFTENDVENAALLRDVLALAMPRKKNSQHTKEVIFEIFLSDLLDGNITDRDVISERLKCLNWTLHENIYVLTIRKKNVVFNDDFYLDNLGRSISNRIHGSKPIVYNNSIVLVINRQKKFPNETEMTYLTELLHRNEMYGGISRCFHAIHEIIEYFNQSVMAIDLGGKLNKQKFLYAYDDYAISHLMSICSGNKKSFCHPSLFLLVEHDRRYSDQMTQCLNEYLSNKNNLERTANALGIHRNTMRYRIKKIQDIMKVDLNDEETYFHLLLSFKILRFMETTKFEHQYLQ